MKAIMLSIKPKYCELIASGEKTIEVRKTCPKLETPFKCYIYMTKRKEKLIGVIHKGDDIYGTTYNEDTPLFIKTYDDTSLVATSLYGKDGKVIGEFVCDRIEEFHEWQLQPGGIFQEAEQANLDLFLKCSCLSYDEVCAYRKNLHYYQPLYGWHITDLVIYDKPKELGEFKTVDKNAVKSCKYRERISVNPDFINGGTLKGACICNKDEYDPDWCSKCLLKPLTRPFQSWGYVEG